MNAVLRSIAVLILACFACTAVVSVASLPSCKSTNTAEDPDRGKAATPRERNREDFSATVRTWGRLMTWAFVLVGFAMLVVSFTKLGPVLGIDLTEALTVLLCSAGTPIVQYALQAWGMLMADMAVWVSFAGLLVMAGLVIWRRFRTPTPLRFKAKPKGKT